MGTLARNRVCELVERCVPAFEIVDNRHGHRSWAERLQLALAHGVVAADDLEADVGVVPDPIDVDDLIPDDGGHGNVAPPPDPLESTQGFVFGQSLGVAGMLHILHNAMGDASRASQLWETMEPRIRIVSRFRQQVLQRAVSEALLRRRQCTLKVLVHREASGVYCMEMGVAHGLVRLVQRALFGYLAMLEEGIVGLEVGG